MSHIRAVCGFLQEVALSRVDKSDRTLAPQAVGFPIGRCRGRIIGHKAGLYESTNVF
jgi:hypothetical protein